MNDRPVAPSRGFTLLELMITVVIVGILAAVAYPSYTAYVARGHRTQVKAQLASAQQWMERFFSERYVYGDSATPTANTAFANQGFAQSPPVGEGAARYTLAVVVADSGQTYTVTATRAGSMANDECGNPTVTNAGVKGVVAGSFSTTRYADAAAAMDACWR